MATQHPDNAFPNPATGQAFVSARDETDECYQCFADLGVEEYMWDWEGKFVDEAVMERLYTQYHDYFKANALGRDKFLTFRVPNIWEEPSAKLPRAFMNLVSAEQAAKNYDMHRPPLFEVIQPMTTSADQLKYLQQKFTKIAESAADIFELKQHLKHVELIPLFEAVESMAASDQILADYVDFMKSEYNYTPEYMRVFIARSDPAMNAGIIPTMLAVKHSLSSYHEFGEARDIEIYPWIGGGSLPFRGGINPDNVAGTLEEYRGTASVTIQSAFRFDYAEEKVKAAIKTFNDTLPRQRLSFRRVTDQEGEVIKAFNGKAKGFFTQTIEPLAPLINQVAGKLPNNRERVQHVGIFGYARGVGEVKLPRAIKFCGAFYSLGVPPELIGTGRALQLAQEMGCLDLVLDLYKNIKADLLHAGHYLNRENLNLLTKDHPAAKEIVTDIALIEKILGIEIGPESEKHLIHRNFASNIYHKLSLDYDVSTDILEAAKIRQSIG